MHWKLVRFFEKYYTSYLEKIIPSSPNRSRIYDLQHTYLVYLPPHLYCMYILLSQVVIDEDDKFLKLLELLGLYQEQGKPFTLSGNSCVSCQIKISLTVSRESGGNRA